MKTKQRRTKARASASPKGNPDAAADPRDAALAAFMETEEFEAWDDFCQAARAALDAGKERAELPTAWLQLVLPEIKTDPEMFQAMIKVWNRECDRLGLAAAKKNELPEPGPNDQF